MTPIKLRITSSGTVQGLWTDVVGWRSLGRMSIRRASSVEFNEGVQK